VRAPRRAYLGLGSNLGDRWATLARAVAGLPDVVAVSGVYETEPVGGPPQGPYLNLVAGLRTALGPRELLRVAQGLEAEAGRVRTVRFGPRTLDVDVLWVEGETVAEPDLVVPHPRMWERRFVLAPLAELAPDLVPAEALAGAQGEVRRIGTLGGDERFPGPPLGGRAERGPRD
jgi:2-amino-4-hydroxy-6-hydroxymethyldihydropteridine diphosphokinase